MIRITLIVPVIITIISGPAYAVDIGFGGGYNVGLPIGGFTGTVTATSGGNTGTGEITDGAPFKLGPVGFGVGAVVGITPLISTEFGFEYHLGYNNGTGTVSGTYEYNYNGETGSGPWTTEITEEDEVKLSIMDITAGVRFNIPVYGKLRPFAGGGFVYAISAKLEPVDEEDQQDIDNSFIKGTNIGAYFGGGLNWFVTPTVAINIPIKYRLFFEGSYDAYDGDGTKYEYTDPDTGQPVTLDAKFKPPGILTFGFGIEAFPF